MLLSDHLHLFVCLFVCHSPLHAVLSTSGNVVTAQPAGASNAVGQRPHSRCRIDSSPLSPTLATFRYTEIRTPARNYEKVPGPGQLPAPPPECEVPIFTKGDPYDFGEILKFGALPTPVAENWALPPSVGQN